MIKMKRHSLKRIYNGYAIVLVLTTMFILAGTLWGFTVHLRQIAYDNVEATMSIYQKDVTDGLDLVQSVLIANGLNNQDLVRMAYNQNISELALNRIHVSTLADSLLRSHDGIDGIAFYAPETDSFVSKSRKSGDPCVRYLKRALQGDMVEGQVDVDKWRLRLLDHNYYLVKVIDMYNFYAAAWVRLDTLTDRFSDVEGTAIYLYTDPEGRPLGSYNKNEERLKPQETEKPVVVNYKEQHYYQISMELEFCDYYLVALIPVMEIYSPVIKASRWIVLAAFLLIIMVLTSQFIVRHFFVQPIRQIETTAAKLSRKDLEVQLPVSDRDYEEVWQLNTAINDLMSNVVSLQQEVYEEKMLKTEFELQYLKSQVAPHFLINCFSAIGSVPDGQEGKVIRNEMIRTLSEHLRYTLGTKQDVTLSEELYYVKNYLALSDLRFPGCLHYDIRVEEDAKEAVVFPLMILMLTENAIKHNLVMGEDFSVEVICETEETSKDWKILHVVHMDSGTGYPEDMLEELNQILQRGRKAAEDGHHLGIYNIVKRAQILYEKGTEGEQIGFAFSNRKEGGARCDIRIPFRNSKGSPDGSLEIKDTQEITV